MHTPQTILKKLISFPSITPNDSGCFDYIEELLTPLGFKVSRIACSEPGSVEVQNFYATLNRAGQHLLFVGHVDVVPPGEQNLWKFPPFASKIDSGKLYGRGAVDMKGSIAAFIAALFTYLEQNPKTGSISLALTADEEGSAINGTRKLLAYCAEKGEKWDVALVGEPSCDQKLGDSMKTGRRGSLSGKLVVSGTQGHVAYPERCNNPLPALLHIVHNLMAKPLDNGFPSFQTSNFELTSIDTGNEAGNIIPQKVQANFNIRYNPNWNFESLKNHIEKQISHSLKSYEQARTCENYVPIMWQIEWQKLPIEAFLTTNETLIQTMSEAIFSVCHETPRQSTKGGTSDARFVKEYCPVIEFGPCGTSMHQIDEHIDISDLESLTKIYEKFLSLYFKI